MSPIEHLGDLTPDPPRFRSDAESELYYAQTYDALQRRIQAGKRMQVLSALETAEVIVVVGDPEYVLGNMTTVALD